MGKDTVKVLYVGRELKEQGSTSDLLHSEGHTVFTVANGKEALDKFQKIQPDIILMNTNMPIMDGYEAASRLKALMSLEDFVPLIFLVNAGEESRLPECLACGGDDFLIKPFDSLLLKAKVDALATVRRRLTSFQSLTNRLTNELDQLRYEHDLAERIFAKVTFGSLHDMPDFRYLSSPKDLVSGDMLLAATNPEGLLHVFLGDFSGHGLSAAIGNLPAAEIFHTMVAKGFSLPAIVTELNKRLTAILPAEMFLASCILTLDQTTGVLEIWNGGMPDGFVFRQGQGLQCRLSPKNLPLGIVNGHLFNATPERTFLHTGDRVYICSDGVYEAIDWEGNMFGQEQLENCLNSEEQPEQLFDHICQLLADFRTGKPQRDDFTIVELICDATLDNYINVCA